MPGTLTIGMVLEVTIWGEGGERERIESINNFDQLFDSLND